MFVNLMNLIVNIVGYILFIEVFNGRVSQGC